MDSISEEEREQFLNAEEASSNSCRSLDESAVSKAEPATIFFDTCLNNKQRDKQICKPLIVKCKSVEFLREHVNNDDTSLCLQKKLSKSVNVVDERKQLCNRPLSMSKSMSGSESSCTCRQEIR